MIINNQTNIKVHFATVESIPHTIATLAADVKYGLGTAYPFVLRKFKNSKTKIDPNILNSISNEYNHFILDSGLFTLMFGSEKGNKSSAYIEKWYQCLSDFVLEQNYQGTMVEVDCQKVLGVNKAWELRQRLKEKVPNRIINVFHFEDGQKGLDRLIEYSDYIALSVPELRFLNKKNHLQTLAHYIKNKKPHIDIHLLGCTEKKLLSELEFCSSADSSSWISGVRYGQLETLKKKEHEKFLKEDVIRKYADKWEKIRAAKYPKQKKPKNLRHNAIITLAAEQYNLTYSKYAGPQN